MHGDTRSHTERVGNISDTDEALNTSLAWDEALFKGGAFSHAAALWLRCVIKISMAYKKL